MPLEQTAQVQDFTIERIDDVEILRLGFPKANSMSPAMLVSLRAALGKAAASDARALIITGTGRSFSAGLALPLIVDFDRDQMRAFMNDFAQVMEVVLTFPKATVAAINGHAIAGGCVLALMCDYRVMGSGPGRIGLNEVAIGIGLPASVIEPLRAKVPARSLVPIAMAGELFDPTEALGLDLIDDVVSAGDLAESAMLRASALAGAPEACAQVKAALLRPVLEQLREHEVAELEGWLDTWFSSTGQSRVRAAVSGITKK